MSAHRIAPDHVLDAARLIQAAQVAGIDLDCASLEEAQLGATYLRLRGVDCGVRSPLTEAQAEDLMHIARHDTRAGTIDSEADLLVAGLIEIRSGRLIVTSAGCDEVDKYRRASDLPPIGQGETIRLVEGES